jgi:hypothetical protein
VGRYTQLHEIWLSEVGDPSNLGLLTGVAAGERSSDGEGSADEGADGGPGGLPLPPRGSGQGKTPPLALEAGGGVSVCGW